MILYSLRVMSLPGMNKWDYYLVSATLTKDIEWDRWFIFYIQKWIFVLQYTSWQCLHQILVKYILRVWYTCWDILGTTRIWAWDIMPIYRMQIYLTSWDRLSLILRTNWWCYLVPAGSTVQILSEIQGCILFLSRCTSWSLHIYSSYRCSIKCWN